MAGPEAVSNRDLDGLQKAPPNSIEAEEHYWEVHFYLEMLQID